MRKLWRHGAVAILALAGAACHSDEPISAEKLAEYDYRLSHPIVVEPRIAVLRLTAAAAGLSVEDHRQIDTFAGQFLRRGGASLEASVGAANPDDAAARAFAHRLGDALLNAGLKTGEIRLQLIIAEPTVPAGSALLRFNTSTAQVPECYDWREGDRNAPFANFGCAVQHNMGMMVANPQDLVEPRPADATSGVKGGGAIDKLNQGTAPWSVPLPWAANSKAGASSSGGQ